MLKLPRQKRIRLNIIVFLIASIIFHVFVGVIGWKNDVIIFNPAFNWGYMIFGSFVYLFIFWVVFSIIRLFPYFSMHDSTETSDKQEPA